jgi:N6-L-threonylcarbamoyladenine synthase
MAKAIAWACAIPFVGVHHVEGHIFATFLEQPVEFPFLALVVSGGHTHLYLVEGFGRYRTLGRTLDDAAGEAFDKVARVLGLPFPGGPQVDKLARQGNAYAIAFPRARVGAYEFSFSGLKTAVMQYVNKNLGYDAADVAASFQQAVVDVLASKTVAAARAFGFGTAVLAGGVACNAALRAAMEGACRDAGLAFYLPPPVLCTDNAAMIASRGYYALTREGAGAPLVADEWDMDVYPTRMTL